MIRYFVGLMVFNPGFFDCYLSTYDQIYAIAKYRQLKELHGTNRNVKVEIREMKDEKQ